MFRRLVEHLRERTDVQNIDLMNLAGFCRNCLSNWMKEAADAKGVAVSKDESREAVYGMPYETWKAKHQGAASPEQLAAMKKSPHRALTLRRHARLIADHALERSTASSRTCGHTMRRSELRPDQDLSPVGRCG